MLVGISKFISSHKNRYLALLHTPRSFFEIIKQSRPCLEFLGKMALKRGARYLTGENLEVVWAEFSTLS